jgi:hypothetical protein
MTGSPEGSADSIMYRPQIQEQIKAEITLQVSKQVTVQIKDHLPVSLEDQVADSKKQFEVVRHSLINS